MDEVNEQIATTLIKQLSNLMTSLELIEDGVDLERDLKNNELLKRDVKNVLSYVSPYIPLVGLVCGGICLGKHDEKEGEPTGVKIFMVPSTGHENSFMNSLRSRKLSGMPSGDRPGLSAQSIGSGRKSRP